VRRVAKKSQPPRGSSPEEARKNITARRSEHLKLLEAPKRQENQRGGKNKTERGFVTRGGVKSPRSRDEPPGEVWELQRKKGH